MVVNRPPGAFSHDLIIVSDLHLAAGFNRKTRKYFHLENFFYDHTFFDFVEHFLSEADASGRKFRLIVNGDIIDFLRIDHLGGPPPRFGRLPKEPAATEKLTAAMNGHPGFMMPLARWIAAGHQLVILSGNHDPEWALPEVRELFVNELTRLTENLAPGQGQEMVSARLEILPWFYYEEGRIWVEHGSQYDPANSRRHPLALWSEGSEAQERIWRQEEPLGSFFQKHLYSWLGNVTFVVPSFRADGAYVRWLLMNRPRQVFKLLLWHLPFLWRIVRSYKGLDPAAHSEAENSHESMLQSLAANAGLGKKLREVDRLKVAPEDHKIKVINRVLSVFASAVAGLSFGLAVLMGTVYSAMLWVGESAMPLWLRGLVFGAANFGLVLGALVAAGIWLLRSDGSADSADVLRLKKMALKIANILDVPIVAFGHSHAEDVAVNEQASYFNTGTWIPVFTGEDIRLRDRVSFPFLLVCGTDVEFLRWDHMLGRAVRFPLLETDPWRLDQPSPAASSKALVS
jgi:UDP-2,3-diacylglucosamine pyrophosphatase LpxH